MASEEKTNICRVCLKTESKIKKCISLFEKYKNTFIYDIINSVANVFIEEGDGLPTKICPDCLLELDNAVNFKQKCETSNTILQNKKIAEKCSSMVMTQYNLDLVKKEENVETDSDGGLVIDDNVCSSIKSEYEYDRDLKVREIHPAKSRRINLKLICDDCGGSFKSKCKLRVHWKKEHLAQALICPICRMAFKSYKAFHRHQKNKRRNCVSTINMRIEGFGKSRIFHCKECIYSSPRVNDVQTHLVVHNGDRPFVCSICGKGFTQQSSLRSHRECFHKMYIVETACEYCGKFVGGRDAVYKHMKLHSKERFQCDICKKILKNKRTLRLHLVRHSGVKSYACDKCTVTFFTIAELCTHKRLTHDRNQYIYKCDKCDYKTHKSYSLKKHKTRHTGTNVPCTICGAFCENADKLAVHQRRHLEEKKYSCPHCELKYFRKFSLSKHIQTKHNEKDID